MGDTLHGIDDRAGKVVGWVDFVSCSGTMMGSWVTAVNDWISKSFVFIVYRDFGPNTVQFTLSVRNQALAGLYFRRVSSHFVEDTKVILNETVTGNARNPIHTLFPHLSSDHMAKDRQSRLKYYRNMLYPIQ